MLWIGRLLVRSFNISSPVHYLSKTRIKNIKRTVVIVIFHVMDKVFHFQLDAIAFIILSAFEFLISELFSESL